MSNKKDRVKVEPKLVFTLSDNIRMMLQSLKDGSTEEEIEKVKRIFLEEFNKLDESLTKYSEEENIGVGLLQMFFPVLLMSYTLDGMLEEMINSAEDGSDLN